MDRFVNFIQIVGKFSSISLNERKMGFSFDGVFRFFEAFARNDQEEVIFQRKEEGEDDVQIMTVTMSKGLEFEIVFALGLASRTQRR